jgi:hypothetical protein
MTASDTYRTVKGAAMKRIAKVAADSVDVPGVLGAADNRLRACRTLRNMRASGPAR